MQDKYKAKLTINGRKLIATGQTRSEAKNKLIGQFSQSLSGTIFSMVTTPA